jgi:hypothetical protein
MPIFAAKSIKTNLRVVKISSEKRQQIIDAFDKTYNN